jgi:hypothetical protein
MNAKKTRKRSSERCFEKLKLKIQEASFNGKFEVEIESEISDSVYRRLKKLKYNFKFYKDNTFKIYWK